MEEFVVEITEILQRRIKVVAESKEEAELLVRDLYMGEQILLNEENFVDLRFNSINL